MRVCRSTVLPIIALCVVGPSMSAGAVKPKPLTKSEFRVQADQVCAETAVRFSAELPAPVGGAKPVGLGPFMRRWVADLRPLAPPKRIARHWEAALDLLVEASHELDAAEQGDPDAQGDALWNLEARAGRHIEKMHIPFKVCFVE